MSYPIAYNTPNMSMYPTRQANILRFILQETGTYNNMQQRPFVSNLTPHSLNAVCAASQAGRTSNKFALVPYVAMLVSPSLNSHGVAHIPNGWSTRRMRFTLTVETTSNMGHAIVETITGYTEYSDLSLSGYVDQNMVFYINSITTERQAHTGTQYLDASTIIPGCAMNMANGAYQAVIKQRQEDLVVTMDESIYRTPELEKATTVDLRSRHSSTPMRSRREEQSAPAFVTGILNAVSSARAIHNHDMTDVDDLYSSVSGALQNAPVNTGGFMFALTRVGQYATNQFDLRTLSMLDPMAPSKMVVLPMTQEIQMTQHQTGMTSFMESPTEEVVTATIVAQSLPALMARCGFMRLALHIDNLSHTFLDVRYCMPNADILTISRQTDAFLLAFRSEVMAYISFGNQLAVILQIEADLNGDVVVGIQLGGSGPITQYVFPTFCDALMTPVLTSDLNQNQKLAADIGSVVDNIVSV